jgi:asparagine synthase (glutamine-hydrolysing)
MRGVIPDSILTRKKMGFPVPLARWFRGEFQAQVADYVTGQRARSRGLFNPSYLQMLVDEHRAGTRNHADKLWSLMNLEIWQRVFVDGEGPPGPARSLPEYHAAATR